jgi:hypothetical protein
VPEIHVICDGATSDLLVDFLGRSLDISIRTDFLAVGKMRLLKHSSIQGRSTIECEMSAEYEV